MTIQERPLLREFGSPAPHEATAERDRLLVEAHLRQDADAFAIIVDEYRPGLLVQARRMLGPNGAAEDVVQETFVRALRGLRGFGRRGEYRLGAWLNHILKNVVYDHRARQARELLATQASASVPRAEADVADRVGDPIVAAALQEAVLDLPSNQRAAFVMREMVGLSYPDVAERLNISEENARARVSRSKNRLRRTTAQIRSAGGFIGIPALVRWGHRLTDRVLKANRSRHNILGVGDRVAIQLSASPVSQTALNLASTGTPRGAVVFGLAATVATLGASTAVLVGTAASPPRSNDAVVTSSVNTPANLGHSALASQLPETPPPTLPVAVPIPTTSPVAEHPSYSWVNDGVTSTTGSGPQAAGAGAPALAAASCIPTNGITPPGGGFSTGPALGLGNGLAVANTAPVNLDTAGASFGFNAPATVATYGGFGSGVSGLVQSNVCLSSSGAWFTAVLSGLGGSPVQLVGTLEETIGSTDDAGYIFRGSLSSQDGLSGPLTGAVQFVADVTVLEPDNTAQLTVVFLGAEPPATPTSASSPTAPVGSTDSPTASGPVTGTTEELAPVQGGPTVSATSTNESDPTPVTPPVPVDPAALPPD